MKGCCYVMLASLLAVACFSSDKKPDQNTDTGPAPELNCALVETPANCSGGWCRIEPGTFTLGSPITEPCRGAYTENQVEVTLTRPFLIGEHEVTQSQWEASGFSNPAQDIGANKPVVFVNWLEATAYANALSEAQGLEACYDLSNCQGTIGSGCPNGAGTCNPVTFEDTYTCTGEPHKYENWYECPGHRLPTSAEWEYAARAGTTTSNYNGDVTTGANSCPHETVADPIAWYCYNSEEVLQPVCVKKANDWGLYDTVGNVREWIDYVYTGFSMSQNAGIDGSLTDPIGASIGEENRRSLKGGSFRTDGCYCRAADHHAYNFDTKTLDSGIRLVRTIFE